MKHIVANLEPDTKTTRKRKRVAKQPTLSKQHSYISMPQGTQMTQITIELVDKRHIIARSKIFKNGAEVLQFRDEAEAREYLEKRLESFAKEGYEIDVMYKDCFRLRKD